MTFDDGPTPQVTETVLKILDDFSAKATFFCIGKNVKLYPDIYQEILRRGHSVGNHSHNHLKGWESKTKEYVENVALCAEYVKSNLFRPPYGRISKKQYRYLKNDYSIIMWSVLSWDFLVNNTPEKCARNVLGNVKTGDIIVFHDSIKAEKNCVPALKIVLEELTIQGYQFDKIDQKLSSNSSSSSSS